MKKKKIDSQLLKRGFEAALEFREESVCNTQVRQPLSYARFKDLLDTPLGKEGLDTDSIIEIIKKIATHSVNTDSPLFMNQMYGSQIDAAILGDVFTTMLNTSMYTFEVAPLMTLIERDCIKRLGKLVGYSEEMDGVFTPGGSISNMMAMVLAKEHKFPQSKKMGLKHTPQFSIFISDQAHYSFLKGALFIGLGEESIIKVKTNREGKINIISLCNAIDREKRNGKTPLMITGTAGTTITGVYDDLSALAEIAAENEMWFHVDAVYGGSLLFSSEGSKYLNGTQHADSISWNQHKMMGIPLVCASLLTKHKGILEKSLAVNASYLFHDDSPDLGQKSIQCGRRVDALKLWLAWLHLGDAGFESRVNKMLEKADALAARIDANSDLELFCQPESPIVCFRYIGEGLNQDQINEINYKIRKSIYKEGKILLNYSEVKGENFLRCVISNPEITNSQLDQIVTAVLTEAGNCLEDIRNIKAATR